jgi:hypothetical protein
VRFDKLEQRLAQLEKSEAEAIKQGEARIVELEAMSFQRIEGRMARLEEAGAIDNNIAALLGKPNASTLRVHSTDSLTKNIFAGTTAAPLADLLLKTDSLTLSACASTAKKPIMSTTPASIGAVAYYLGHLRSFQWSAPTLRDAYAAFTVDGKRQAVPVLSVLVTRAMSTLSTDSQVITPQRIHPSTLLIPLHPPSSSLSTLLPHPSPYPSLFSSGHTTNGFCDTSQEHVNGFLQRTLCCQGKHNAQRSEGPEG